MGVDLKLCKECLDILHAGDESKNIPPISDELYGLFNQAIRELEELRYIINKFLSDWENSNEKIKKINNDIDELNNRYLDRIFR
ncbi:hypothetical protein EDM57_04490 [Brevibacillus gelatini]|uniref:Uncharacterized protein n=1 Tax=Brevibacillus gelatini TaxID=1655277 RepID=A0A3M8B9A2_9BACL|nr:hypothetical protein [Brevibacillus gelatini]RNB59405.1 hypothetical protein EDM57_04490 [Brevibacillus gelatini]